MTEGMVPGGAQGSAPGWSAPGAQPTGTTGDAGHGPAGTAYPSSPAQPGQWGQQAGWGAALPAHKPGIIALRPLSLGDIVEASFACLRRNPRTFLGLALVTSLAVLVVIGVLGAVGYVVATSLESGDALDLFLALGLTSSAAALLFLSSATSIALSGILAYPVGEAVLGRNVTMGETWGRTRRFLPRLVGLCAILVVPPTVVFGLLVALAIWGFVDGAPAAGVLGVVAVLCLAVATTWLGIRLALATPALVLEDLGVIASLRRSWRLTPGLFWRTFGILLASSMLIGVVQYVLSFALQLGGMVLGLALDSMVSGGGAEAAAGLVVAGASVLGSLLSGVLTQPFLAAVLALLYTDARIRKEGFDLALARAAADAAHVPTR
ncbi:glycerophosphoryl diester phosphodiesterase membrane domain-containing protein [Knoellia sp. p5-6-4]|uniref:glycerophosphoryl diester phosphodiesterase membrane domain-containing protein n=1 Tax=unclassified Knoellia TaxID=2618719 RepID=UPI0023DA70D9|nr:glycerophosphoryl diester phosphodiesterase membrane domain-containing protein [Knoellia sp. p5-6-4]MDF2146538.1 glycerophosphoryl diester phosphodiesterase membrane domain-containing protein [Knoellia sp. p5-6-4]